MLPLIFIVLCSCVTSPPDVEVCKRLPSKKGYCFRVISLKGRQISPLQFERMLFKGIVINPEEYAELKKFILKVCTRDNTCYNHYNYVNRRFRDFEQRTGLWDMDR